MYDPQTTQRAIAKASETLAARLTVAGSPVWALTPHSPAVVASAVSHFEALLDPETGQLTRPLTPDERRFIRNERQVCALDFTYWGSRYARIISWTKEVVPFTPNVAQSIVLDLWGSLERQAFAILMLQLKARQLGVTTLTEMAVCHRFQFHQRTNAVVASADPKKSVKMAKMIRFCLEAQPWWLLPSSPQDKIEHGMTVEFAKIHTALSIQAGNQFNGLGRGDTPNVFHLCLAPQSLVRVQDGFLKPVALLTPGEKVLTHDGRWSTVRAVQESPRRHELATELWIWGTFAPLVTTRDHPVRVRDGWVEASRLHPGEWVSHPVRPIRSSITSSTYVRTTPGRRPQQRAWDVTIPLSSAWGWLLGLYLAEGSIQPNRRIADPAKQPCAVVFAGDRSESAYRVERLRQALGPGVIGIRRARSRTEALYIANAGLARWIVAQFGQKDLKRVPDWVWDAGPVFCLGIVEGYLHGDGHFVPQKNDIYATSVRVQLPIQIRDLIASLGCGWSAIQYKSAGVYSERNCRESWTLIICGKTGERLRQRLGYPTIPSSDRAHWRYAEDGQSVELEIAAVHDAYSATFYDLEVSDPVHSFTTAQCAVANSEICEWPDPELLIDAALLNAIHETPDVFGVLESTALGRGDYLHLKWRKTKQAWATRSARLVPVFLPWYVGTDIYPTPGWLRMHPIPPTWTPSDLVVAHAERARDYVLTNPLLRHYLARDAPDWRMPRPQMWWYAQNRQEAVDNRQLNLFLSEMPADDQEAFQSTNISVFSPETIQEHRVHTRAPLGVYTITGTGIPSDLVVERRAWDPTQPPIIVTGSPLVRSGESFTFIPLTFEGYADTYAGLRLFIWEFPEPGATYGVGVDTSDGVGQDWTVLEVLRRRFPEAPDIQVAEFASPYVKALQLWPMTLAVGAFYSVYNARVQHRTQCRIAVECKGNGESVQWELQKRGWTNFHPWKKLDNKRMLTNDRVHKLGVFTNAWYRPMMLDRLLTMLEEGSLQIASPFFVDEMEALEKDENRQSLKANYGEHDDRIMALGFILDSLHVDDRPYGRSAYALGHHQDRQLPPTGGGGYATCPIPDHARDLPNRTAQVFIRGARGSLSLSPLRTR